MDEKLSRKLWILTKKEEHMPASYTDPNEDASSVLAASLAIMEKLSLASQLSFCSLLYHIF